MSKMPDMNEMEVIETIENENGTAIKFSDGTMICTVNKIVNNVAIDIAYNQIFVRRL